MERTTPADNEIDGRVTHGYVDNNGVNLHYVSLGTGPLVVMLHGFPDFWYTWRYQMPVLAQHYQVVAPDLRGYNLSDKPQGGEQYAMPVLESDVQAIIRHLGHERAIIAGHDWGGMIAWFFAMHQPDMVERLVVLNVPHPHGLARELAHNPEQQRNSQYARDFQQEGAHLRLTPRLLTRWITDPAIKARYLEALGRSDIEAMLHYYKQNYPREPYTSDASFPQIQAPTLIIHGLRDKFLLASGHNNTWQWVDNELTLVTVPHADHFVQHDAADLVTRTLANWLRVSA